MIAVCVHIRVRPEHREAFIEASLANARSSIQEPGNLRFDVIQQADDANRFMFYEVWRDEAGMKAHKETDHYARWRDTAATWLVEPRQGIQHAVLFPTTEAEWATRRQGTPDE